MEKLLVVFSFFKELATNLFNADANKLGWILVGAAITGACNLIVHNIRKKATEKLRNIPATSQFFVDRKVPMRKIKKQFIENRSTAITQAIQGMGGIGKTQLAYRYARKYGRKHPYAAIYCFKAQNPDELESDVFAFLGKAGESLDTRATAASALQAWYSKKSNFLLIFDNAESYAEVQGYLLDNALGHGRVLITTRNGKGFPHQVPLDVFSDKEADRFLKKRLKEKYEASVAGKLRVRLGNFPLALSQAVAYILKKELTIPEYLKEFTDTAPRFAKDDERLYESLVEDTWEQTHMSLTPDALHILKLCAYLSPEQLPVKRFAASPFKALFTEDAFDQALEELRDYSMIDPNNGIHRLVQEVLRKEDAAELLPEAIRLMKNSLRDTMDADDLFVTLALHASAAAYHAEAYIKPTEKYVLNLEAQSRASAYKDHSKIDCIFKWRLLWTVVCLERLLDVEKGSFELLLGKEMLRNADGSVRLFGGFEWEVLKYSDDKSRVLIVTRKIISARAYDEGTEEERLENSDTGVTWKECSLRAWLNSKKTPRRKGRRNFDYTENGFLEYFTEEERAQIIEVPLANPSMDYTALNGSCVHTPGGVGTADKVFLLSVDDILSIFDIQRKGNEDVMEAVMGIGSALQAIDNDTRWYKEHKPSWNRWLETQFPWSEKLIACETKRTSWWWLRSPGRSLDNVAFVRNYGRIDLRGYYTYFSGGVRPALWLAL